MATSAVDDGSTVMPGEGRDRELALGRLRGRASELRTQIERAEQDVALGAGWWARRRMRELTNRERAGRLTGPLVSVITPAYDTEPAHLEACLASVAAQSYGSWEHIVVDDGSTQSHVAEIIDRAAARDDRVRLIRHDRNGGIVAASNTALDAATGEYVAMLDHDDVLTGEALERMVEALRATPDAVFAYSDNDVLRADGRAVAPFYKPDFSLARLRSHNYILHFVLARLEHVRSVGCFRPGLDGAQDHDLLLRLSECGPVTHVPEILYHWREAATSVAADPLAKPYAYTAGVRAVQDHCDRTALDATVESGSAGGIYRLRRRASDVPVSVVIPTRGSTGEVWGSTRTMVVEAVGSMLDRSTHPSIDVVVVADTDTPDPVTAELIAMDRRISVVDFDGPFNFSAKCNVGAQHAIGELLLFLNDDTELIEPDSVSEMAGMLEEPGVGMVGAKLLFADGTMQHAGHVYPGLCTHALTGIPGDSEGPYRMAVVERECSGVTAAAAMIRADRFEEVGRFDEAFPANFNDVDLSLRLRRAGYRIVWTPHASWFHFESASRDPATSDAERDLVIERWDHEIRHDPYFNPNLAPHRHDWLERPGRSGAPPYYVDETGRRCFS